MLCDLFCFTYGKNLDIGELHPGLVSPKFVTLNAPSVTGRCPATPAVCLHPLATLLRNGIEAVEMVGTCFPLSWNVGFRGDV